MSLHTLHLTVHSIGQGYEYTISCPGCVGWQECPEYHAPVRCDDPECCLGADDEEDCPNSHEDPHEFHGVSHTYRWGHGWTVPYPGCVLAAQDLGDDVYEIARTYGPGDYLVDDDWDDEWATITPVSMADGSPLPLGGAR